MSFAFFFDSLSHLLITDTAHSVSHHATTGHMDTTASHYHVCETHRSSSLTVAPTLGTPVHGEKVSVRALSLTRVRMSMHALTYICMLLTLVLFCVCGVCDSIS